MVVPEVRDSIFIISPSTAAQKNPLASVHTILRRLVENGEAIAGEDKIGRIMYAWVGDEEAEQYLMANVS